MGNIGNIDNIGNMGNIGTTDNTGNMGNTGHIDKGNVGNIGNILTGWPPNVKSHFPVYSSIFSSIFFNFPVSIFAKRSVAT